ncbi:mRNA 3'-end-processing protein rna14 [Serendipita sp. 399]|nr:mRNA 3'-end-processing protein rna14 [Serendipita sp. 399]
MADVEQQAFLSTGEAAQHQNASQNTDIVDENAVAPANPFEALQTHLRDDPHDVAAWQDLVNIAEDTGDFKLINEAYSSLLKAYPNTIQAQISYMRHSQRAYPIGKPKLVDQDSIPTPQALFSQWLKQSPDVELWKLYLEYVRSSQASSRDVVKKAYEFALRFVGQDREAGEIWKDYIEYIKDDPTSNERENQEKMDLLRSVYRRAVQIPIDNLEQIWREWDSFENGLNKLTAKKFLADVSPDYMTARMKKTEIAEHHKRIGLFHLPAYDQKAQLELPTPPVLRSDERALVASWRKYLEFEESNPLGIEEKSILAARIMTVYRKAVIKMRFYPEVWYEAIQCSSRIDVSNAMMNRYLAYLWTQSVGKGDDAHTFLKNGLDANPTSFLLNFAYSEVHEQTILSLQTTAGADPKKVDEKKAEGHEIYKKFIATLKKELDSIEEVHIAEGGNPVSQQPGAVQAQVPVAPAPNAIEMEDELIQKENEIYGIVDLAAAEAKEREQEREAENERREAVLITKRVELGQASIAWMRYAKRVGQSAGLRNVFKEIRADKWVCWQVFEAAALLEHQISPTADVAAKIFELGLRFFLSDVDYVVRYLNFLINKCDEANARALFERVVVSLDPEKARPIWQRWLSHQMDVADLPTLQKLDKRIAETKEMTVDSTDRAMKQFAQRYLYLGIEVVTPPSGIDAIASHDLQTPLKVPSVILPPQPPPVSAPLAPQQPSNVSNGSHVYPHSYNTPQPFAPPNPALAAARPPAAARVASPLQPPKRPLPEPDAISSQKRARRSPPPQQRRQPPPPAQRRWGSPQRDERRRGRSPERAAPPALAWFLSQLPNPRAYDGPVFNVEEFLKIISNVVVPTPSASHDRIRSRSPPPPPRNTRGPPDYGPYQGPGPRPRRY